jgi:predicted GIY-YIG superfamily endonuclease
LKQFRTKIVVYRLTCETQTYIGKTERILAHRIKEHLNLKKDSAIQTHLQENPTHVFDPENIEILDKATSNFKIRLKEELHIITHKPEPNSQHAAAYKRKHNKNMFKSNIKTLIIS